MIIINKPELGNLSFVLAFYQNGNALYSSFDNETNEQSPFVSITEDNIQYISEQFKISSNKESYSFKGFIPRNVLHFSESEPFIIWTTKAGTRKLHFKNEEIKSGEYPVPNLLWVYKKSNLWIYAIKKEIINENTKLYNAPFLNLYSDGSLCTGNVDFNTKNKDYETIMKKVELLFYESYFTHTNHSDLMNMNIVKFYEENLNSKRFDNSLLKISHKKIDELL